MFDVKYKHTSAPQLWFIPISFACLILLGTVLFKLPWMVHPDQTISWVDSFFVSTSAVCITGLSPITIGDVLSFPGQIVLLFLVQMGGIGIFTSSLLMVVVVGQRFSLADEQVIQATIGKMQTVRPMDVFIYACFFIFFFEVLGAILYLLGCAGQSSYFGLELHLGTKITGNYLLMMIWDAVFHSVNAFCNSGFSLYPEGMVRMQNSPYFLTLLGMLVLLGSLGLMTLINLRYFYFWRRNKMLRGGLLVQTKVTLIMTAVMIVIGIATFLIFEHDNTLASEHSLWLRFCLAFFHSANARSGGLNAVDLESADPTTMFSYIGLMFVGGGSGSMAGGIKVTTFFVILMSAWSVLCRREDVQVFEHRIPANIIHIALMIGFLYAVCLSLGMLVLVSSEAGNVAVLELPHGWLGVIFDAVSAFGTVGLSSGAVGHMTVYGKIVLICMMYVGRILTLTLAVYLMRPWEKTHIKYPEEAVSIG